MPKASPTGPCEACHADAHGGQFKKEQPCASCHVVASWTELPRFNHDRDTHFALTGKHATATCVACHPAVSVRGMTTAKWVGINAACDACHADAHVGQFVQASGKNPCETCHDAREWKTTTFAHAPPFTTYLLEGAHEKVPCSGCHPAVQVAKGATAVRYKPIPRACEACHADFHKGEFRGFMP
jgi:hypothetical protein